MAIVGRIDFDECCMIVEYNSVYSVNAAHFHTYSHTHHNLNECNHGAINSCRFYIGTSTTQFHAAVLYDLAYTCQQDARVLVFGNRKDNLSFTNNVIQRYTSNA